LNIYDRGEIMCRMGTAAIAAIGCFFWSATALAQSPVKIGLVQTYSGPLSIVGIEASDGFEFFFEQQQMKVAGRPVSLIKEDDAANPSQGLERVRRLVEREQVHLLTGITSSAVAYAVRSYVDQRQVPLVIMGSAGANGLTDQQGSPYIFRTSFSNRQLGGAVRPLCLRQAGLQEDRRDGE
jgi:branched-chain amino acid transport system substrate-binding protein